METQLLLSSFLKGQHYSSVKWLSERFGPELRKAAQTRASLLLVEFWSRLQHILLIIPSCTDYVLFTCVHFAYRDRTHALTYKPASIRSHHILYLSWTGWVHKSLKTFTRVNFQHIFCPAKVNCIFTLERNPTPVSPIITWNKVESVGHLLLPQCGWVFGRDGERQGETHGFKNVFLKKLPGRKTSHVCMLVHEVHERKSFERINQFSVLIRAEREVKNDISQSRMWWITKPARVCSCLTSGWCGQNRTDVSWIGIKALQGFRQRGHVRSEVKLSPVMQKKKLLKAVDCGDTFILNWFHIIFNSPFEKKQDQLRLGCDVMHGAISPRVNRTEQWSPATWNERGAATLHSPPKAALSDDNIVIHRWQ